MNLLRVFWMNTQNFGDVLNYWLLEKISRKQVVFVCCGHPESHYVSVGSILNWASDLSVVWGAGLASRTDKVNPRAKLLAVRGPISGKIAEARGNKDPKVYGDPALLLPNYFHPYSDKTHKVGVIPHFIDMETVLKSNIHPSIKIINPMNCVERVLNDIGSCEKIISSSLHGLIAADAYGVPNLYAKFTNLIGGDGMKYEDHFLSVGIEPYKPKTLVDLRGLEDVEFLMEQIIDRKPKVSTTELMKVCPFGA